MIFDNTNNNFSNCQPLSQNGFCGRCCATPRPINCNSSCSLNCGCRHCCFCRDGKSAYELAVQQGFVGTLDEWLESLKGENGTDGINGADGKSAYELAVQQGYVGTLDEWLESLKGEFDPGETLFSITTPNGVAEIGFEDSLVLNSNSINIFANPATPAITLETKPVGVDVQFYSNESDARLQSSTTGERAFTLMVGNGFESVINTGGIVTTVMPLKSHKVLKDCVVKEVHAMVRISLAQTDLPSTVFAQLYVAPTLSSAEFSPVAGTVIELGTLATGSPVGSALEASIENLNINVAAGSQLMLGFYNITAAGGLTTGTVGFLSGAVRLEDK